MKSRFFFNAVLIFIAAAFVLPLFSCSDASNDVGSGMVSFYVDKALMQKAVELSDKVSKNPNDEPRGESERRLRFVATLEGEYNETKTVFAPYEGDFGFESFSIDFAAVPVGKTICAKIRIYNEYTQEPVEERPRPIVYGKSQNIRVNSGVNPLAVEACSYRVDVQVKIEIQFDQEPDLSFGSNCIYAVDPMSSFVAKLNNAKGNELRLYEVCNQFMDKYWDDCLGEIALTQENTTVSDDGKTVTVEGDMSLCVSEDDPASRAADARFVLLGQNISYDGGNYSYKTKYYGMTSSTVIPIKGRENIAEFSAQKLNVIDTPYALYNLDGGYDYYLRESPSADVSGSPDFSSSGTSGQVPFGGGPYKQSFCYDADGNFYTMSIYPEGGSDNYIYSTNTKIGEGGYHFEVPYKSFACDLKRNELYLYDSASGGATSLYATGDFIKTGTFPETPTRYRLIHDELFPEANISENFAIYDGVAYFALTGTGYCIAKADLLTATPDGVELVEVAQIDVGDYVYPQISDMIAVDDAVYVILRDITPGRETGISSDRWDGTNIQSFSVKSRGCLVKCDLKSGEVSTLGWNGNTVTNESLKGQTMMYLARLGNTGSDYMPDDYNIYNDEHGETIFLADGSKRSQYSDLDPEGVGEYMYKFFPALNACFGANKAEMESNLSSCFASPAKFIAIKPKKLVISDDGLAFYTDALGGLAYKNVDRVVTIDLENFAIESVKATSAQFERQLSGWFSADIDDSENTSLNKILNGGTFYAAFDIYYRGSSPTTPEYIQVRDNGTRTRAIFLAIKNGDEE